MTYVRNSETSYEVKGSHFVEGIRYLEATRPEYLDKIRDFEVYDGDIYLCGYPKAGNLWVSTIIRAILQQNNLDAFGSSKLVHSESMLDFRFPEASKKPHPGPYLCHLQYKYLPTDLPKKRVKIVYVARDAKDVAVSYYHFHSKSIPFGPWIGSWETFFDAFLSGDVVFGSWFDHLRSYWTHRHEAEILFVRYEDLIQHCHLWIKKIAAFLERPLDPSTLERIHGIVQFDNMKSNNNLNPGVTPLLVQGGEFLRKGVIGDWKTLFTEEQRRLVDKKINDLCEDIGCYLYSE